MSSYVVRDNFTCALDKRKYWTAVGMFWTFWSRGQSRGPPILAPKLKTPPKFRYITGYRSLLLLYCFLYRNNTDEIYSGLII